MLQQEQRLRDWTIELMREERRLSDWEQSLHAATASSIPLEPSAPQAGLQEVVHAKDWQDHDNDNELDSWQSRLLRVAVNQESDADIDGDADEVDLAPVRLTAEPRPPPTIDTHVISQAAAIDHYVQSMNSLDALLDAALFADEEQLPAYVDSDQTTTFEALAKEPEPAYRWQECTPVVRSAPTPMRVLFRPSSTVSKAPTRTPSSSAMRSTPSSTMTAHTPSIASPSPKHHVPSSPSAKPSRVKTPDRTKAAPLRRQLDFSPSATAAK